LPVGYGFAQRNATGKFEGLSHGNGPDRTSTECFASQIAHGFTTKVCAKHRIRQCADLYAFASRAGDFGFVEFELRIFLKRFANECFERK
jgi:hypothetical protein